MWEWGPCLGLCLCLAGSDWWGRMLGVRQVLNYMELQETGKMLDTHCSPAVSTYHRAAAPRCWSCGELVFVGVHSDLCQRLWTRTRAIEYAACTQWPVLSVLLLPEAVSQPDVHKWFTVCECPDLVVFACFSFYTLSEFTYNAVAPDNFGRFCFTFLTCICRNSKTTLGCGLGTHLKSFKTSVWEYLTFDAIWSGRLNDSALPVNSFCSFPKRHAFQFKPLPNLILNSLHEHLASGLHAYCLFCPSSLVSLEASVSVFLLSFWGSSRACIPCLENTRASVDQFLLCCGLLHSTLHRFIYRVQ